MKMPLTIYTNSAISCPYCVRAKDALTQGGYQFDERDIADPEILAELRQKRPSAKTVPQIFVSNGYHIGGCDDLIALMQKSRLDVLIELNHDERE
jgi:glutaredoxin 3